MKHLLNTVAVLFAAGWIAAPLPALAAPGPAIAKETEGPHLTISEPAFDFGRVKSTDVLKHEFTVTNSGKTLLEIRDVKPGCGCMTAGAWDRRIQPGQTGKIPIQFSPAKFSGAIAKGITVTCNDPVQAAHTLQIRATVWHPIDVQPAFLYFTPIAGEETSDAKVVRIISNVDQPLTLELPNCSNPAFKLEMKTVLPGREFELRVKYTGPTDNSRPQGAITIKTSSTDLPVITIGAGAMAQQALAVMPPQVTLPAGPLRGGYRHSQMIRNNSSTPVKLTEAAVNAPGVVVEIAEVQPGKVFRLNLSFPPNFKALADKPLELTVHTSNPRHPLITVPVKEAAPPPPAAARTAGPAPVVGK